MGKGGKAIKKSMRQMDSAQRNNRMRRRRLEEAEEMYVQYGSNFEALSKGGVGVVED